MSNTLSRCPILSRIKLTTIRARFIHLLASTGKRSLPDNHKVLALQLLDELADTSSALTLFVDQKAREIEAPTLKELSKHVEPGKPLLPRKKNDTKTTLNARELVQVDLKIDRPFRNFKSDTKDRDAKQFHIADPANVGYLSNILYRAYKFIEMGYPIEFHLHLVKRGNSDKREHEEALKEYPHLWPSMLLKAMPEGTSMVIPPYAHLGQIMWVLGHVENNETKVPCKAFKDAHAALQRAIELQTEGTNKEEMAPTARLALEGRDKRLQDQLKLETELASQGIYVKFGNRRSKRKQRLALGESLEDIEADLADDFPTPGLGQWRGYKRMKHIAITKWKKLERIKAAQMKAAPGKAWPGVKKYKFDPDKPPGEQLDLITIGPTWNQEHSSKEDLTSVASKAESQPDIPIMSTSGSRHPAHNSEPLKDGVISSAKSNDLKMHGKVDVRADPPSASMVVQSPQRRSKPSKPQVISKGTVGEASNALPGNEAAYYAMAEPVTPQTQEAKVRSTKFKSTPNVRNAKSTNLASEKTWWTKTRESHNSNVAASDGQSKPVSSPPVLRKVQTPSEKPQENRSNPEDRFTKEQWKQQKVMGAYDKPAVTQPDVPPEFPQHYRWGVNTRVRRKLSGPGSETERAILRNLATDEPTIPLVDDLTKDPGASSLPDASADVNADLKAFSNELPRIRRSFGHNLPTEARKRVGAMHAKSKPLLLDSYIRGDFTSHPPTTETHPAAAAASGQVSTRNVPPRRLGSTSG